MQEQVTGLKCENHVLCLILLQRVRRLLPVSQFGDFCYESMSFGKLHTVGPTPGVAAMIVPEKSDVTKVTDQDTIMNH